MTWSIRRDRRLLGPVVLLAWTMGIATGSADPAPTPGDKGVPPSFTTIGPPVPLSAAQRAALAAKRAVTQMPRAVPESSPTKAAAISTIPGGAPSLGLKTAVPGASLLAPSAAAQRPLPMLTDARRAREEAAIAAVVAALGPEMARRAGLIKDPEETPIRRSAAPSGGAR